MLEKLEEARLSETKSVNRHVHKHFAKQWYEGESALQSAITKSGNVDEVAKKETDWSKGLLPPYGVGSHSADRAAFRIRTRSVCPDSMDPKPMCVICGSKGQDNIEHVVLKCKRVSAEVRALRLQYSRSELLLTETALRDMDDNVRMQALMEGLGDLWSRRSKALGAFLNKKRT